MPTPGAIDRAPKKKPQYPPRQPGSSQERGIHTIRSKASNPPQILDGVTVICSSGDVILKIQSHEKSKDLISFRVDTSQLSKASPHYFQRLFEDSRFEEAAEYKRQCVKLKNLYSHSADIPIREVPQMRIVDIGAVHVGKTIGPLLTDFFLILHGLQPTAKKIPIGNLANLAIVADRFDCLEVVAHWANSGGHLAKAVSGSTEESIRQKLLVGMLLGDAKSVSACSKDLILTGSVRWASDEKPPPNTAMWWDLPKGVEAMAHAHKSPVEEMLLRRTSVLETIWSLPAYCIKLYTSRTRQCRLGYDNSMQCDSFQLGEFVRFLTKLSFLKVCTLTLLEPSPEVANDVMPTNINLIMSSLRSCPSYQIDPNHAHCGPRKMMIMGLDTIQSSLTERGIGICYHCWTSSQPRNSSWRTAKRPLSVSMLRFHEGSTMPRDHSDDLSIQEHYSARGFFTANDKIWGEIGTIC